MKKFSLTIALFILSVALVGCGGGTGSSSQPTGVDSSVPSVIQLLPIQSIAQTNTYIVVKAKVLDGNGYPLPGTKVTFTNLSLVGSLSATAANTDPNGLATVTLSSTTSGFSTIQAEVNGAAGMARDKRTVFFSDYALTVPSPTPIPAPTPTLTLEVDGNNNDIYNEPSDFILFETPDDNEVTIRATLTEGDIPVSGSLITFGSDTTEGTFPLGNTAHTDDKGQAFVLLKVDPIVLRSFSTVLNVTASADDGAANIVSLFLDPVLIDTVSVFADPQTVDSGATSKITATVSTTAGNGAPDGTAVSFTTTNGSVTPFSQTTRTNDVAQATATFTAPTLVAGGFDRHATITASTGGKSGSVEVTIVAPPAPPPTPTPTPTPVPALVVNPPSASIPCGGSGATFFVTGGAPAYTVTVSFGPVTSSVGTIPASGGSFTVTSASCTGLPASTLANVIVKDSANTIVTVPVTVTNPTP